MRRIAPACFCRNNSTRLQYVDSNDRLGTASLFCISGSFNNFCEEVGILATESSNTRVDASRNPAIARKYPDCPGTFLQPRTIASSASVFSSPFSNGVVANRDPYSSRNGPNGSMNSAARRRDFTARNG